MRFYEPAIHCPQLETVGVKLLHGAGGHFVRAKEEHDVYAWRTIFEHVEHFDPTSDVSVLLRELEVALAVAVADTFECQAN